MQFGDKEIMTDLLMGTKYISANYHRAVLESANDRIRNTLIQLNNEEINLQKQIFNIMHDRYWYEVRPANASASAWQGRPGVGTAAMHHHQMPY
ncbi:spore coat protein [Desulfoscipio gibsoniae]|uniref:Coat F domain-containing protein n=1 Tax=Desulfoscipio gibsoniae DSM 7213 TaxID=767817 RepID=R4KMC0_9FIRM|nr:spore coat protein [Desulfoscipio gibsoniae]AGL00781.1 coat F domain-containing protein [Desulfoscipio gibsoniae DSM 7213]